MNEPKLLRTDIKDKNNKPISLVYNETDDILDIFFGENEPGTGIELTDHILLRLNRQTGRAISLTLLHFSILTGKKPNRKRPLNIVYIFLNICYRGCLPFKHRLYSFEHK